LLVWSAARRVGLRRADGLVGHTFEELSREAADVMDTVLVDIRSAAAKKARRSS
jgi:hypothetical protein